MEINSGTSNITDERDDDRSMKNLGTQTTPTKGRPKEVNKTPYEQIDWKPKEMGMPMYIDGPHIEWLTEKTQRILMNRKIPTRIACKTPKNPMFGNVKDQTPIEEKGNTIFSMECRKCGETTYLYTGYETVGEEAQRAATECK